MHDITTLFKGRFFKTPEAIAEKFARIKAVIFDWDGVFTSGQKDQHGSSFFSEIDAMGQNLLRFALYMQNGRPPVTAIISGERNATALAFAQREHYHHIYCGFRFKPEALQHLQDAYGFEPDEVLFFYDDILDLSLAKLSGMRMMMGRTCNPMMNEYVAQHNLADYISASSGGNGGLRECVEMLVGSTGKYADYVHHRSDYTPDYQRYLSERNIPEAKLFLTKDGSITQHEKL